MSNDIYSTVYHRKQGIKNEFITVDVDPNNKAKRVRGYAGCLKRCCYEPCKNIFAYLFLLIVLFIKLQVILYKLYYDPVIIISLFICNYIIMYVLLIYY